MWFYRVMTGAHVRSMLLCYNVVVNLHPWPSRHRITGPIGNFSWYMSSIGEMQNSQCSFSIIFFQLREYFRRVMKGSMSTSIGGAIRVDYCPSGIIGPCLPVSATKVSQLTAVPIGRMQNR